MSDSLKITTLTARDAVRRLSGSLRSSKILRWPLAISVPDKVEVSLGDLMPADALLAQDYYNGRFALSGVVVETSGDSPFISASPSRDWQNELHSFSWLRHIAAADTNLARAHGNGLLHDWVMFWGNQTTSRTWSPAITARRLLSWCRYLPLLASEAHPDQTALLHKSAVRQAKHLYQKLPVLSPTSDKLQVLIALAAISLCYNQKERFVRLILRELDRELQLQIKADGVHISRNPQDLILLLADLIPLRNLHSDCMVPPSSTLVNAIDRMASAVRFFQHSHGELAQFNGTGETDAELLQNILNATENSQATKSAPQSGYERLAEGGTIIIADTGSPENTLPAADNLAGTLSFELSSGKNTFIMNCGVPVLNRELYLPYARSTAAHSTLVLENASSSRYTNARLGDEGSSTILIRSPQKVLAERSVADGGDTLTTSHDGYLQQFGFVHQRRLTLCDNGETVLGADSLDQPKNINAPTPPLEFCLRFHLPPNISASLLANGHSILLAAPDRDAWTFTCIDAPIALEESIRFAGREGPRKTEQIVVRANTNDHKEVRWTLNRRKKKSARRTTARAEEPDLLSPLDDPIFEPEGQK